MNIDITKLRPFTLIEWKKDTKQKVYYDGKEVTKLIDFETGVYRFAGLLRGYIAAFREIDLRLAPKWELAPPPWGEWHRKGWNEEMLPEGYRPLMNKEKRQEEDEVLKSGNWEPTSRVGDRACPYSLPLRTRRPLPDRWAAEKAAHAAGKRIEWRCKDKDKGGWTDWRYVEFLSWFQDDSNEYRIAPEQPKPEPKWRDLAFEDFPPGSSLRFPDRPEEWHAVISADTNGVETSQSYYRYNELREQNAEIIRPGGQWEPCKVEVKS